MHSDRVGEESASPSSPEVHQVQQLQTLQGLAVVLSAASTRFLLRQAETIGAARGKYRGSYSSGPDDAIAIAKGEHTLMAAHELYLLHLGQLGLRDPDTGETALRPGSRLPDPHGDGTHHPGRYRQPGRADRAAHGRAVVGSPQRHQARGRRGAAPGRARYRLPATSIC